MMLTEKHYKCINMLLYDKKTLTEAAKELGVNRQTIYNWMKDEDFDNAMTEARQNIKNQCEAILNSHVEEAYQELWKLCHSSDPRTARASCESWIERCHGKVGTNITVETNENDEKDYNIDAALDRIRLLAPNDSEDYKSPRKTG